MLPLLDPFRSSQNRHWLLAWFFAAQVHWTVAMSQMIQDDSQLPSIETQPAKMEKWNKCFLERKGKVWVYTLNRCICFKNIEYQNLNELKLTHVIKLNVIMLTDTFNHAEMKPSPT